MKDEILVCMKIKRKKDNFWALEDDVNLKPKDAVVYLNDKYT